MHVFGYVYAQVDAAKKEDPGLEVKKEDKEDPTTAAIPALSEAQQNRLIATGSSAFFGTKEIQSDVLQSRLVFKFVCILFRNRTQY